MAQLYKAEYRRYGVQVPAELADEVDRLSKAEFKSASQVIVETLSKGMRGYGTLDPKQVEQWMADEVTLMRATRTAIDALHGPADKTDARLRDLARFVIEAGLRGGGSYRDGSDQSLKAAEDPPPRTKRTSGAGPADRVSRSA